MTRQVDDRLRLLREVLDLIDEGEIIASPAQTSFLRGVELGLTEATPTPTGTARSRRADSSTSETSQKD